MLILEYFNFKKFNSLSAKQFCFVYELFTFNVIIKHIYLRLYSLLSHVEHTINTIKERTFCVGERKALPLLQSLLLQLLLLSLCHRDNID